jgi:hypothetical protein
LEQTNVPEKKTEQQAAFAQAPNILGANLGLNDLKPMPVEIYAPRPLRMQEVEKPLLPLEASSLPDNRVSSFSSLRILNSV